MKIVFSDLCWEALNHDSRRVHVTSITLTESQWITSKPGAQVTQKLMQHLLLLSSAKPLSWKKREPAVPVLLHECSHCAAGGFTHLLAIEWRHRNGTEKKKLVPLAKHRFRAHECVRETDRKGERRTYLDVCECGSDTDKQSGWIAHEYL